MVPFARYHFGTVVVEVIRCLQDNYVYFIGLRDSNLRAVIDPGEAAPVERFLAQEGFKLDCILNTHHHHDHVGGNVELQRHFHTPALASAHDLSRIEGLDRGLEEGEKITAASIELTVLTIPGHTQGQVAFFYADTPLVFVGDTLFSMGCGRLFEGTAAQMLDSLHKLMRLPPATKLFVGHEYTIRNGAFAASVEPHNELIRARVLDAQTQLSGKHPHAQFLAPISMAEEKLTNPFLRADRMDIASRLDLSEQRATNQELAVFTQLRKNRDRF